MKSISKTVLILLSTFLFIPFACKKETNVTPVQVFGTFSDRDGNVYKTIAIGTQTWMAEDLKVKTYQNGDSLNNAKDANKWILNNPSYCIVDGGNLLYNWFAINDPRKIAPAGWHIPSDSEWKTLEIFLGMSPADADKMNWRGVSVGDKLKTAKETIDPANAWSPSDDIYKIWPTNESGFSALANGCRMFSGQYGDPGAKHVGFWWSSSENKDQAWYRYLDYNKAGVFRFYGDKRYGFNVRCIKD